MSDDDLPSPYLRSHEAAAYLRLEPRTLDNMRQRGTGPVYSKNGGRVVYHRDDLASWAAANRRLSSSRPMTPSDTPSSVPPDAAPDS